MAVVGALVFLIANEGVVLNEKRKANIRIVSEKPENSEFIEERFALAKLHLQRNEKNMALRILNDISQEKISDEFKAIAFLTAQIFIFVQLLMQKKTSKRSS